MADRSDNIESSKERLSIESKLLELQKELGEELSNQIGLNNISNSIQEKTAESFKKQTEDQRKKLEIQKNLSKEAIKLEKIVKNGITDFEATRDIVEKIRKLREEEATISKKIEDSEKNRAVFVEAINLLGFSKMYEFSKKIKDTWKENQMVAVLMVANILIKNLIHNFLKIFQEVDGAASEFRRNMGFVRADTAELEKNIRNSYFTLAHTGLEAKTLYGSMEAVSRAIGTSRSSTQAMREDMALMATSLGVSLDTSAEFSRAMGMMAKNTMDSQKNIALFTTKLSAAAGTNLNEVMGDVAKATSQSYQFMTRSPVALAKAAVEARRLGTNIAAIAESAKSLVEFTKSVEDEMRASVLLGESINLQRARELAYRKDLKGLNEEILKIAKESRFEELDPFQQDAVAKALGKSADELGKMLQSDREMRKIRADGSLSKEVKEYDRLKNANDALVKSTAESAREQLRLKSNMEATKSISLALTSIYRHLFQPFVDIAAKVLPEVAKWLSWINLHMGKWAGAAMGLVAIFGLILGSRGLGKIVSWATGGIGKSVGNMFGGISTGVKSFGSTDVLKGAVGLLLVATSLIPLAYALKLMQGVEWKTLAVAGVALTGLVLAVAALGAIMSSGVGTVAILAGAAALVLVGAALIPVAYAFKLFGEAVKILYDIDLLAVGGGLAAMVPPLTALAIMAPLFPMLAFGISAFGLAVKLFIGPIERLGMAALQLGVGLESAFDALARMTEINLITLLAQFKSLSNTIYGINKALTEMPEMKLDKLQNVIIKAGEIGVAQSEKSNEEIIAALNEIKSAVLMLKASLEKGGIMANVQMDSQRVDSALARALAFKGTLTPQPTYVT